MQINSKPINIGKNMNQKYIINVYKNVRLYLKIRQNCSLDNKLLKYNYLALILKILNCVSNVNIKMKINVNGRNILSICLFYFT